MRGLNAFLFMVFVSPWTEYGTWIYLYLFFYIRLVNLYMAIWRRFAYLSRHFNFLIHKPRSVKFIWVKIVALWNYFWNRVVTTLKWHNFDVSTRGIKWRSQSFAEERGNTLGEKKQNIQCEQGWSKDICSSILR